MKKSFYLLLVLAFLFGACERAFTSFDKDSDPLANFDDLWNTIDKKYSYFTLKKINWDSLRTVYRSQLKENSSGREEYEVYQDLLFELSDGHVNMFAGFDFTRNWEWYLNAPPNFDYSVIERNYLGRDHWISAGLRHSILDEKYGYIYYRSFSASAQFIEGVLRRFEDMDGIIFDVRDNGGGSLGNAEDLADAFADQKRLTYRKRYKHGEGHDDFGPFIDHFSEPDETVYSKPVIVLTNRKSYSATSFFVTMMKEFPHVLVLGDLTGGGAGLPIDYTMRNGWVVRFSGTQTVNADGEHFELGVAPDIKMDLDSLQLQKGVDSLIESAKALIDQNK